MSGSSDQELLHAYAQTGCEEAFAELVRRYVDIVYSVALRVARNTQLAEEVSQTVFVAMARNARTLASRSVVTGWLHRTARNVAANCVRTEVRRRAREQAVAALTEVHAAQPDPDWETVAPGFDAALCELSEPDREAICLRFFQGKSAIEIGATLGISGEAAQKRVHRAVERLRDQLGRQGLGVGATVLASLLAVNAVCAAPAALKGSLAASVLAANAAPGVTFALTSKLIVMTTLQKVLVACVLLGALGTALYESHRMAHGQPLNAVGNGSNPAAGGGRTFGAGGGDVPSTAEVDNSRGLARTNRNGATSAARPFTSTRIYALLKGKVPQLSLTQLEPYVNSKGRNADALLAAFRTSRDPAYLAEAMKKFPDDPQVAFEAVLSGTGSDTDRRRWLDQLKKGAPDNSIGNYLSAAAYLKSGQPAEALQDLIAASGKKQFEDYSTARAESNEEAYVAAGYSSGEAKLIATTFVATPHLVSVKDLGQDLVRLASSYQQAGDQASHDSILGMAVELGRRLAEPSSNEPLLSQLVGIRVERTALSAMPPEAAYGDGTQTVQQRLQELAQRKESIHVLTSEADPIWERLLDQDWLDYYQQYAASGEEAALHWLVANYRR